MREILFKAKRVDNGEWVIGHYIPFGLDVDIHYDIVFSKGDYIFCSESQQLIEINIKTLCQYTGLSDKHGNKIFENDIVTMSNENYVIVWETDGNDKDYKIQGFGCNHIKGYMGNIPLRTKQNERLEIIGNKFDNPELLEKGGAE